jgi:hypothetical protein
MSKAIKNFLINKFFLLSFLFFFICLRIIFSHYKILQGFDFLEIISFTGDDFYYYLSTAQNLRDFKILSFSIQPQAITNGFQYIWFLVHYFLGIIFFENPLAHIKSIMLTSSVLHLFLCSLVLYTFLKNGVNLLISFLAITFLGSSNLLFTHLWAGLEIQLYFIFVVILINRLLINSSQISKKSLLIDSFVIILLFLSRTEGILFIPFLTLVRFWQIKNKLEIKYLIIPLFIFFSIYFTVTYIYFGKLTQSSGLFYSTFLQRSFSEKLKYFIWFFTHYEGHFDNHSPLNIMSKLYHNKFFHYSIILIIFLNLFKNSYQSYFKKFKYVFFVIIFYYISIATFYSFNQKVFLIRYTLISVIPIMIILICIMQDILTNLKIFVKYVFSVYSGLKKNNKFYLFISKNIHTEFFMMLKHIYFFFKTRIFFNFFFKALIFILMVFYFNNTLDKSIHNYKKNSTNRNELHAFYKSGFEIKNLNLEGSVGGWNVGAIGFSSGNKVINLDGRINSEIFDFKDKSGNQVTIDNIKSFIYYAEQKNIKYVVDGKTVVTDIKPWFYKTSKECINKLFLFDRLLYPEFTSWYFGIALYKVDLENGKKYCLE